MREDVLQLLDNAVSEMQPGQIVLSERTNVYAMMASVEIGDPRVDAGMLNEAQKAQPRFDAARPLLPDEIVLVMDDLLRCEMTWHTGYDLAATLFTCLYVHHLDEISLPELNKRWSAQQQDAEKPIDLLALVLRPYVMAVVKSCDIVWCEFAKGHLVEVEDISTEKHELLLLEDVEPDEIIQQLEGALAWLNNWSGPDSVMQALYDRILFRLHLFYALCVIGSEGPSSVVQNINSAREMLLAISQSQSSDSAREAIRSYGIFDANMSRQLPARHPPMTLDLLDRATCIDHMSAIIDTLADAVALKEADGWATWATFFTFKSRKTMLPYCRSILQTSFFDDNNEAKLVVGRRSLTWLAYSFMHQYTGMTTEELDDMKRSKAPYFPGESERSRLGYNFGFWIGKLAGQLVNLIRVKGMNRSRQKRKLLQCLPQWTSLIDQVSSMLLKFGDERCHGIKAALELLRLDIALESVISGFDLELYHEREWTYTYWLCIQLINGQLKLLSGMMQNLPGSGLQAHVASRMQWSLALRDLCSASMLILSTDPNQKNHNDGRDVMQEARFLRRLSILPDQLGDVGSGLQYGVCLNDLQQISSTPQSNGEAARDNFLWARRHLHNWLRSSPSDTATSLCVSDAREFATRLDYLAASNLQVLENTDAESRKVKLQTGEWFSCIAPLDNCL